jgi:hypothetical protein
MTEKQIKAVILMMKDAHGIEESELLRHLDDDSLLQTKITELKGATSNGYRDGLADGTRKAKGIILDSIKKELEIDLGTINDIKTIGIALKPLVEEKFKTASDTPPADESKIIKDLKKAHETEILKITTDRDTQIAEAKNQSERVSTEVRMDAIARKLLTDGGYTVPADATQSEMKFAMAQTFAKSKGFKYELDADGKYYRLGEDGIRARSANSKPISYEDDLQGIFDVSYGKTPASPKGGVPLPNNGAGSGGSGVFDWSKYANKTINPPTTVEEGLQAMRNPSLDIADKTLVREWTESEMAKQPES